MMLADVTLTGEEITVAIAALDVWIGKMLRELHDQDDSEARRHGLAVAEVLRQRLLDARDFGHA